MRAWQSSPRLVAPGPPAPFLSRSHALLFARLVVSPQRAGLGRPRGSERGACGWRARGARSRRAGAESARPTAAGDSPGRPATTRTCPAPPASTGAGCASARAWRVQARRGRRAEEREGARARARPRGRRGAGGDAHPAATPGTSQCAPGAHHTPPHSPRTLPSCARNKTEGEVRSNERMGDGKRGRGPGGGGGRTKSVRFRHLQIPMGNTK